MPTNKNQLIPNAVNERHISRWLPLYHFLVKYHRYQVHGLNHIPRTGRCILVVNHSLATYDGLMLGIYIYLKTGRMPAGLADTNLFRTKSLRNLTYNFRLAEANHRNGEKLLKNGELLCLAPGGMREALRPSSEKYQVCWEKRTGFVKLAIKTQTPVIVAACPKADDIYKIFPSQITKFFYKQFKLPFPIGYGLGPTAIPRPVKLTHYISAPITPPKVDIKSPDFPLKLKKYHHEIINEMNRLLNY